MFTYLNNFIKNGYIQIGRNDTSTNTLYQMRTYTHMYTSYGQRLGLSLFVCIYCIFSPNELTKYLSKIILNQIYLLLVNIYAKSKQKINLKQSKCQNERCIWCFHLHFIKKKSKKLKMVNVKKI